MCCCKYTVSILLLWANIQLLRFRQILIAKGYPFAALILSGHV